MISEIENYVVEAIINFYNYDYTKFFEYLDEAVIWYGPKDNQFVVGKDNLINEIKKLPSDIEFSVDNIKTKLIPFVSTGYTVVVSYTLHVLYPNKKYYKYNQRVIVNAHKHHDKNGEIFWRCPLLHVSNTYSCEYEGFYKISERELKNSENIFKRKTYTDKHIVLPGNNHSTVYIKTDSVNYIVGGKGVLCYVHTDSETFMVRKLLKDVINLMPENFYRCHSSYIINLNKILYLSSSKIILTDKTEIPISSRRYSQIKSDINNWLALN